MGSRVSGSRGELTLGCLGRAEPSPAPWVLPKRVREDGEKVSGGRKRGEQTPRAPFLTQSLPATAARKLFLDQPTPVHMTLGGKRTLQTDCNLLIKALDQEEGTRRQAEAEGKWPQAQDARRHRSWRRQEGPSPLAIGCPDLSSL